MTNDDAKFILRSFRSDGRYDHDPLFREALEQARREPELTRWLAQEQALDESLAAKIEGIAPPVGLREAILVGARASRRRNRRWGRHAAIGIAATVILAATLTFVFRPTTTEDRSPVASRLAQFGLEDMITNHADHLEFAFEPTLAGLQQRLSSHALPYSDGLDIDFEGLRDVTCRTVRLEAAQLYEICFLRDGTWFHFYMGRAGTTAEEGPVLAQRNGFAAASWSDGKFVYALVVHESIETLRRYV